MKKIKIFKSGSNETSVLEQHINQFLIEEEVELIELKTLVNDGEIICFVVYEKK